MRLVQGLLGVLGGLLALVGAVWTLQGANVLGGSFMSGSARWLVIGVICVVAGAALVVIAVRRRSR